MVLDIGAVILVGGAAEGDAIDSNLDISHNEILRQCGCWERGVVEFLKPTTDVMIKLKPYLMFFIKFVELVTDGVKLVFHSLCVVW